MNKIAKKIFAFASLLAMSTGMVACGGGGNSGSIDLGIGGGGGLGGGGLGDSTSGDSAVEQIGWWEELAQGVNNGNNNNNKNDYTGDVVINGDPTAVVAYDGSPVTVKFYHTMGANLRGILDAWIPVFNAMYPNITIEHESHGDYPGLRDQITTEIQADDSPNLAYCYPDHVALYNKARVVATLDDYIASTAVVTRNDGTTETMGFSQAEVNEFVRAYYEEGRSYGDNKMYTLPYSKSTEVLYYNKTFFNQHNLTVPTTWDEMEALIQKIAAIDEDCVPLGYDSEANWFITMCEQLGTPYTSSKSGEKFLFDVETNQAFVGRLREWYKYRYVTTEETSGSYTSDLFTQVEPGKLKAYMCIGSSAGASYQCPDPYTNEHNEVVYPFEVGVAMPPQIDPANPKVISQGPSICMFKKTNPQEMAATWLFMKFLTTNLGLQANFSAQSGYAPVVKNLDQKLPAYATVLATADGNANLQATCVKQCLAQENAMFVSPAFVGSSAARDQVGILMQNCFINDPAKDQSVADFIKNEFNTIIQDLRINYGA